MNLIDEIVARTRSEVASRKARVPQDAFKLDRKGLSLIDSIAARRKEGKNAVISEIKPASPSLGSIREMDPRQAAADMKAGGACAISVLTEPHYFSGSIEALEAVRKAVDLPILRKDFIVDEYQLYEAKHYGADAVLLMVAVLGEGAKEFLGKARGLGMEALVEAHDEDELEIAIDSGAKLIGINNRNLKDLNVDLGTTERLAPLVQGGRTIVSESGVKTPEDLKRVVRAGAHAVLVGSSIMRAPDITAAVRGLVEAR